jgi:hypothetical protein
MSDLKETRQTPGGARTDRTPPETEGEGNRGADFGAAERGTRGTDRDHDETGTSKNPGHGHTREERGEGA